MPSTSSCIEYPALTEYKAVKKLEFYVEEEVKKSQLDVIDDYGSNLEEEEHKNDDNSCDDEFDDLLDDDFGLENEKLKELENRRRQELEYTMMMRHLAGSKGYGVHRQIHPNSVLDIAGLGLKLSSSPSNGLSSSIPQAVVLHLFDPNSAVSASLDYFLETALTKMYAGTMFLRSNGRLVLSSSNSSIFRNSFSSKINDLDRDIPSLMAIQNGSITDSCRLRRLTFNGNDTVEQDAVHSWLEQSGVLLSDPPIANVCAANPENELNMDCKPMAFSQNQCKAGSRREEKSNRFICGLENCNKFYAHAHVGINNSFQDGLIVKEESIIGEDRSEKND